MFEVVAPGSVPVKTVLVTGASSGIGYELARVFAREGYSLVLIAKDRNRLEWTKEEIAKRFPVSVRILTNDLSHAASCEEIFRKLQDERVTVDVLVNNAGFGDFGFFHELDLSRQLDMIRVNAEATTHLTRLFLPGMVARKQGKILNVASTAAFQPGPLMAVYYATKAYVLSFSEALSNELEGTGVTVTALCPGPVATEFQKTANLEESSLVKDKKLQSAAEVADFGYRALIAEKAVAIPGFTSRLMVQLVRFLPRSFVRRYVRRLQEKRI